MFGNLLNDMKGKQADMKNRLKDEVVETTVQDGAIHIKANANREILDINIDPSKLDLQDIEAVEDLLVVAINEVLTYAQEREAAEAEDMLKDMIPFGLSGLFGGGDKE